MAMTYLFAYDIVNDRTRRRVAALLQTYGDRIQRSVFACPMRQASFAALFERVTQMLDGSSDVLHCFELDKSAVSSLRTFGQASNLDRPAFWMSL